jgi:hypothetical protein
MEDTSDRLDAAIAALGLAEQAKVNAITMAKEAMEASEAADKAILAARKDLQQALIDRKNDLIREPGA